MTDTGGMELLERGPSLALLAEYAAEARRGDGRLVAVGGEAGVAIHGRILAALRSSGTQDDARMAFALEQNLQGAAGRPYCNFHATYCIERRYTEAELFYAEGVVYCDEHDITTYSTFLRSERTGMLEKTG